MTTSNTKQDDSDVGDTAIAYVVISFGVFLLIGLFIGAVKLVLLILPESAFFQGMLFGFRGLGVWTVTVSTCLFSLLTMAHPRPLILVLNLPLLALTVFVWSKYMESYSSFTEAIGSSIFELIMAIVLPTMWLQHKVIFDTLRLSNAPSAEAKQTAVLPTVKKPRR